MPQLGPLIAGAFAGLKATLAAGGLGAFLIRTGVSVGLSLLSQALAPKPKAPGLRIGGTEIGEDIPQSFPLGRAATAGHLEYHGSHGQDGKTPNAYYTLVISLSDAPGVSLRRLAIADRWVELGETPHTDYGLPVLTYRKGSADYAWIKFYDGTQTTADPMLVAKYGADPDQPWTTDHVGHGAAYAIVTLRLDREQFQGVPALRFELGGVPLYDPRLDTTAGGDGPQRRDDPATWAPSDNLALQVCNLLWGIPLPDGTIYGGSVPFEDTPLANVVAGLNVCDEMVGEGDDARPRFHGGIEVRVDEEPASYIEALLAAGLGQISEVGGVFRTRWGEPDMPVLAITDGDISISDPQSYEPFPGLEATHNAIRITHPSPDALWEPIQTPLLTNEDWEAEDGGRRLPTSLSLPACFDHGQAQAVASGYIEDARRWRHHQIVLPADAQMLEPLDTLEWSSARNGYADKLFEVVQATYLPGTLFVALTIREREPEDYDWSPDFELPAPPAPEPTPIAARTMPGTTWALSPAAIVDAEDTPRRPALRVTWDPEYVEDCRALRWQVEATAAEDQIVASGRATPADGELVIVEGILPETGYRVRLRPVVDQITVWSDWKSTTTGAVYIGEDDLGQQIRDRIDDIQQRADDAFDRHDAALDDASGVVDELRQRIEDAIGSVTLPLPDGPAIPRIDSEIERIDVDIEAERQERSADALALAANIRAERDRIRRVAQEVLDLGAFDDAERQDIRANIAVELGDARAEYRQAITVLTDGQTAIAQDVTVLQAQSGDLSASITAANIARADGDEALALQIALLSVGSAVQFDHAAIWYWDDDPEGWTGSPENPSVTTGGWLVPGAASYIASPTGLAVPTKTYRQVRARVRGEPEAWEAWLWWAGESEGWDTDRRVAIPAPDWADDQASLTVNAEWSGVIDRIRLDLPDGVELDWLAVGRPAPGASSADVASERLARIAADEALASQIDLVAADLVDAEGLIAGNASAISGLTARVTDTEDGIETLTQAQTALEGSIEDLETGQVLLGQAVDLLEVRTEDLETGQSVQSSATRALRSTAQAQANELLEGLAQSLGRDTEARELVASATQDLRTRIDLTDDQVLILAEAVTILQAAIPGLATADALQMLVTRVEVTEDGIAILVQDVTALQASLGDTDAAVGANATAISGLTARVTATEGEIDVLAQDVTDLRSDLTEAEAGIAANAGAISSLTTRVTDAEGEITVLAQSVTDLQVDLEDAEAGISANAGAISGLDARVTSAEGTISSQATAITALQSDLSDLGGDVSANAGAINSLDTRVTSAEGTISAQATAITNLQSGLSAAEGDIAANAGAISGLTTRVTATEDGIDALAQDVTALQSDLSDLDGDVSANAGAISGLVTQVTEIDGEVTALAASKRVLEASIRGDNLLPNGDMSTGDLTGWTGVAAFHTVAARDPESANEALRTAPTPFVLALAQDGSNRFSVAGAALPVKPGDRVSLTALYAATAGASADLRLQYRVLNASDSVLVTYTVAASAVATYSTWRRMEVEAPIEMPANAAKLDIRVARWGGGSGTGYLADLHLRRINAEPLSRIDTIEAVKVDGSGAVAAVNQVISAQYGDLVALAEATAFAEATVDGIIAGYVWKLGDEDVLSLIRVEDGEDVTTTVKIAGDYIRLDGFVEVTEDFLAQTIFAETAWITSAAIAEARIDWAAIDNVVIDAATITGAIESENYDAGVAGFRIDATTGDAEFNTVIARRQNIDEGAVTDFIHKELSGAHNPPAFDATWRDVLTMSLGPCGIRDVWVVNVFSFTRGYTYTIGDDVYNILGRIQLRRRTRFDGVWTSWQTIGSERTAGTSWEHFNYFDVYGGVFEDVEYALQWRAPNTGAGGSPPNLFRDLSMSAERTVR